MVPEDLILDLVNQSFVLGLILVILAELVLALGMVVALISGTTSTDMIVSLICITHRGFRNHIFVV